MDISPSRAATDPWGLAEHEDSHPMLKLQRQELSRFRGGTQEPRNWSILQVEIGTRQLRPTTHPSLDVHY